MQQYGDYLFEKEKKSKNPRQEVLDASLFAITHANRLMDLAEYDFDINNGIPSLSNSNFANWWKVGAEQCDKFSDYSKQLSDIFSVIGSVFRSYFKDNIRYNDDKDEESTFNDIYEKYKTEQNSSLAPRDLLLAINKLKQYGDGLLKKESESENPDCDNLDVSLDAIIYANRLMSYANDFFEAKNPSYKNKMNQLFLDTLQDANVKMGKHNVCLAILTNILFVLGTGGLGLFVFAGKALYAKATKNEVTKQDVFFATNENRQKLASEIGKAFEEAQDGKKSSIGESKNGPK